MSTIDAQYAPAEIRDRFLVALDGADSQLSVRLALGLRTCANPLPGMTCRQLDLPDGSTYGSAARRVLERAAAAETAAADGPGAVA